MPRETSPFAFGEYWLDKRRDGRSPGVWQIASYKAASRSIGYRSTHCKELEAAKAKLVAHVEAERTRGPQAADEARVIPLLVLYWEEHGQNTVSPGQIQSSLRAFIGFLMQDAATVNATIADLGPPVFRRFQAWRMGAHSYDVPWAKKDFRHKSEGVGGNTVQRNLDDIRAALNHHVNSGRLPYAPKVPIVPAIHRAGPRDRVLSDIELGGIIGYATADKDMIRWVLLMLATGVRPIAAAKIDPAAQFMPAQMLIDLHPPGLPRTKKHNPVVPVIPEFAPWLRQWARDGNVAAQSRKRRWNTMRRALGLPPDVIPKTIRHTVATRLRSAGVPAEEISGLLGHSAMNRMTAVYAKYDPAYLAKAKAGLSTIWADSMAAAHRWLAGHLRAKVGRGETVVIERPPKQR